MTSRPKAAHGKAPAPRVQQGTRRWLLFVHQLPSNPSNLRVRTWRRLQQLGAIPIKQAVYVLPDTPSAREDFEWLKDISTRTYKGSSTKWEVNQNIFKLYAKEGQAHRDRRAAVKSALGPTDLSEGGQA